MVSPMVIQWGTLQVKLLSEVSVPTLETETEETPQLGKLLAIGKGCELALTSESAPVWWVAPVTTVIVVNRT